MSLLQQRVAETLSNHGALAHAVTGFQPREGQTDMAMAVTQTLEQGGQLVVEAGTGVGKTYAYLVPVLLSGQRVIAGRSQQCAQSFSLCFAGSHQFFQGHGVSPGKYRPQAANGHLHMQGMG